MGGKTKTSGRVPRNLDADALTPAIVPGSHVIARYRCVGVSAYERTILCECGWDGHESLFQQHRMAVGMRKGLDGLAWIDRENAA